MKRFFLGFLLGAVLCSAVGVCAVNSVLDNPYKIYVNGEEKNIQGYNIDGYSYFKLRDVSEAVGGFSVAFADNSIQLYKDGYVPKESKITSADFTPEMKNYLSDCSYRIPDFKQNSVQTQEFVGDFIFYFYTGKEYERDCHIGVPWDVETVKNQYRLLFGYDMPEYNPGEASASEYKPVSLENGKYYIALSDFGEVEYTFDSIIETADGIDVVFNRGYVYNYVNYVEENFYGTTTFSLKKADNENGFIITSVVSRDANGNEYD